MSRGCGQRGDDVCLGRPVHYTFFVVSVWAMCKMLVVDATARLPTPLSFLKSNGIYCLGLLCSRCRWLQAREWSRCWKHMPKLRHPNVSCMQFPARFDDGAAQVSCHSAVLLLAAVGAADTHTKPLAHCIILPSCIPRVLARLGDPASSVGTVVFVLRNSQPQEQCFSHCLI